MRLGPVAASLFLIGNAALVVLFTDAGRFDLAGLHGAVALVVAGCLAAGVIR